MERHYLENFSGLMDLNSSISICIFILGFFSLFFILKKDFGMGFLFMLFNFLIYIINTIISNLRNKISYFYEFLDDLTIFFSFAVNIIIFGFIFYNGDLFYLTGVVFFAVTILFATTRNWLLEVKNSVGFPLALNGLFFPLVFYLYIFFIPGLGRAIFLFYFLIVGMFSVSRFNFLGHKEIEGNFEIIEKDKNK